MKKDIKRLPDDLKWVYQSIIESFKKNYEWLAEYKPTQKIVRKWVHTSVIAGNDKQQQVIVYHKLRELEALG